MKPFDDTEIVTALRAALPEVQAIILFGSYASGDATPASDLDLAVLLPGRGDPVRLWQIGQTLAVRFDIDVDLVDLIAATTLLQYQIVTTGRRLFTDGPQLDLYECYIHSAMMDLRIRRAPILADIQARGSVYGDQSVE